MVVDQNQIQHYLQAVKNISLTPELFKKIISLIDLTSLNDHDTEADIVALCQKAETPYGSVAAVCIYPQFVHKATQLLANKSIKIATVANFPFAKSSLEFVTQSIETAIKNGAQEIDVVFPYPQYLARDQEGAQRFIEACKKICGPQILLKVILETGELASLQVIADISNDVLLAGADFLKTSTGKVAVGATPEAAIMMLLTIRRLSSQLNRVVGFKAAGGVRTIEQAAQYIGLAETILGPEWVTPKTFRIGASQLLDVVVENL